MCVFVGGRGNSSLTHDGETYYFCSKRCKRAFEKTPGEYDTVDPVISGDHDHHW
ncbi:YHS domain-containing protein [Natronomonas marina]|jgi:hypothetical protein|uniref:YHS domain-containing protein n=1 Tax=Natronomonas marina TaxID=2961939 RepID=UPI0020C9A11B|nr:YHS domain-containing protein [Natronomonas marina]